MRSPYCDGDVKSFNKSMPVRFSSKLMAASSPDEPEVIISKSIPLFSGSDDAVPSWIDLSSVKSIQLAIAATSQAAEQQQPAEPQKQQQQPASDKNSATDTEQTKESLHDKLFKEFKTFVEKR